MTTSPTRSRSTRCRGNHTDTFTVQTKDIHGATGTATFTVAVAGANDAPTLSDVNAGTLTDTAATDTFSNLTGHLTGNDADTGETATLTYSVLNANSQGSATGHYGALTVDSTATTLTFRTPPRSMLCRRAHIMTRSRFRPPTPMVRPARRYSQST